MILLTLFSYMVLGCLCCPFHTGSTASTATPGETTVNLSHRQTTSTILNGATNPPENSQNLTSTTTTPPSVPFPISETSSTILNGATPTEATTTGPEQTTKGDASKSTTEKFKKQEEPCFCKGEMLNLRKELIANEAIRLKAYDAQPKNKKLVDLTICVGFNLRRGDAEAIFKKLFPKVNFKDVKAMKKILTKEQCLRLFEHDLNNVFIPRAKRVAGDKFCDLPTNVKIAIVSAVYRGDLAFGHKTAKLIREGKWCKVSKEYLNNKQYKNAVKLGIRGIRKRMQWNAKQFDSMCEKKK